jgi:hypothetical protein
MKLSGIAILSVCASIQQAAAQTSSFTTSYTASFPMGETRNFISKPGFRGFTFDYRYHQNKQVSFGLSTGWYVFYEEMGFDTYVTEEGATYWAKQFRYLNSFPILATLTCFSKSDKMVTPFIGVGAGITYMRKEVKTRPFSNEVDPWHFTVAPEAGLRIKSKSNVALLLSARYNYNFKTPESGYQSYMGVNIGLMY